MRIVGGEGRGLLNTGALIFDFVDKTVSGRSGIQLGSLVRVSGGLDVLDRAGEMVWSIQRDGVLWRPRTVILAPDGTELGAIRRQELTVDGEMAAYFAEVPTGAFSKTARFEIVGNEVRLGDVSCTRVKVPGRRLPRERVQVRFRQPVTGALRYLMATVPYECQGASAPN